MYVRVAAFCDADAGAAHANSEHFKRRRRKCRERWRPRRRFSTERSMDRLVEMAELTSN